MSRYRRVKGNYLNFYVCEWTMAWVVPVFLFLSFDCHWYLTFVFSCFSWVHVWLNSNPSEWKEHIYARYEVNTLLGTRDSNLIEMSVARRECQRMHRICVFVSALSSSPSLLSSSLLSSLCSSLFSSTRGEPCIRWRTHLTHHPNNRGWPWAVSPINHLTFTSRHQSPSPPTSTTPHPPIRVDQRQLRKTSPDSPAYKGRRQSSTIPHDCQYKSDGSNYPSPSGGQKQASRPLFNFNVVQPYYTLLGGELQCMSRESRI